MGILDWLKRRIDVGVTKSNRPWRDFIIPGGILRTKKKAATLPIVLLALLIAIPTIAHALTPYQSGYQHGLKDANMTYGLSDFMAQGGFGSHTTQFNQGYIDGWCLTSPGSGSDSNNGTFECSLDTTAAKNNNTR